MTPTPRGPYRNGIRSREQIVSTAMRVFAEHGYAGGSLRSIADEVGLSPASLIKHFGSKENLLMAVLESWRDQTNVVNPRSIAGIGYFQALNKVVAFHVEHRGLVELFITMAAEASSKDHPAHDFIKMRYDRTLENFTHHLRQAVDRGEIRPISQSRAEVEGRTLIAVLDGFEMQWLVDPSVDLAGLVASHLDELLARWAAGPP